MRPKTSAPPDISGIILKLFLFLAADEERLGQFLALSGFVPQDMRERHSEPVFQGFLLDYLFQDDAATKAFCTEAEITPEALMRARHKLPGGAGEWNGAD